MKMLEEAEKKVEPIIERMMDDYTKLDPVEQFVMLKAIMYMAGGIVGATVYPLVLSMAVKQLLEDFMRGLSSGGKIAGQKIEVTVVSCKGLENEHH